MREVYGNFLNSIIHELIFPLEEQEHIGFGKDFWCLDWWAIEIAKCLYEGKQKYLDYASPRRLEENINFNKKRIIETATGKIEALEEVRRISADRNYSKVLVFETCRGLDTLLVFTIKQWDIIYVTVT